MDFQETDGAVVPVGGAPGVLKTGLEGNAFGCSVLTADITGKRSIDPLFALMLAISAIWMFVRRTQKRAVTVAATGQSYKRPVGLIAALSSALLVSACGAFDSGSGESNRRVYIGAGVGVSNVDPHDSMGNGSTVADNTSTGCLLYTSPSPRDATLSRMPSSA